MQSPSGESNEIELLETRFKQRREEKKLRKDLPVFLSSENDPEAAYKVLHPYSRSNSHDVHLHSFTNKRNLSLAYVSWLPKGRETKGVLVVCHGFNHRMSDAFDIFATLMTKKGFAVWGLDFPGCGRSEGLRGYIPSFEDLASDARQFTHLVRNHYKRRQDAEMPKIYLYGESLGGAIGIMASNEEPSLFDGLVLCVPLLGLSDKMKPNFVFRGLLSVFSRCFPRMPVPPPTNHIDLCFREFNRDEMLEMYEQDQLMYKGGVRLKTAYHLVKVAQHLRGHFKKVKHPFIILQGTGDDVVDHKLAEALIDESPSKDKTLIYYENGCHVLPFDKPEIRDYLYADVVKWLDDQVNETAEKKRVVIHRKEGSAGIHC